MNTATKTALVLAALALLALPTAVDAATATATHESSSDQIYCYDQPYPLRDAWRFVCGVLSDICRKTDWCR